MGKQSVWLVWLGVHAMRRYMMGDDYMAAPVLNLGQRARMVYFPLGADWTHHYTVRHTEYENLDQLVTSQHFGEVLALIILFYSPVCRAKCTKEVAQKWCLRR